jgi:ABC-type transport system involved in multi-copper enzyme maturation permease subunit
VNHSAPGREFFAMVMVLNLSFIALAALSIFPGAIAEEKEDDTLTLLRMTNLSALSILFGKSTTRLLAALLLLAVQIPFTLMAITLGGVGMKQVWGAYAVLGATTFFLCNLSLIASVYCRTAMRAGFLTAILGIFFYVVLPFIGIVTTRMLKNGPFSFSPESTWDHVAKLSFESNPLLALFSIVEPRMMGGGGLNFATSHLFVHLIGGVICFLIAWLMFDRYCSAPEEVRRAPKVKNGRPRRWAGVSRTWFRRPVAWKEFYFTIGGRFGFLLRLALCGAIFATVYGLFAWEYNDRVARYADYGYTDHYAERFWRNVSGACLVISGMCAGLELILLVGRLFGTEHRRLTLASLVALPWSVGKLIRQKILGVIPVFAPWLILACFAFFICPGFWSDELADELKDISWRHDREEICGTIYIGLQTLLLLVTIVWFSLRIRRGALPAAVAVVAVWNVGFVVFMDALSNRNEWVGLLVGSMFTLPALLFVCTAVRDRIQLAAAEE